ncbi:MAG: hypothetical protein RL591_2306 [Planctomycetota bacterium]
MPAASSRQQTADVGDRAHKTNARPEKCSDGTPLATHSDPVGTLGSTSEHLKGAPNDALNGRNLTADLWPSQRTNAYSPGYTTKGSPKEGNPSPLSSPAWLPQHLAANPAHHRVLWRCRGVNPVQAAPTGG